MTNHLLTVTTAGLDPTTLIALAVLAWLAWRLVLIAAFPWAPCRHCKGTGKHRAGRYWRPCRRCGGTGRRQRLARRLWAWTRTAERGR